MKRIFNLLEDQAGATAIEYAAIASLISVVVLGAMITVGAKVIQLFEMVPNF